MCVNTRSPGTHLLFLGHKDHLQVITHHLQDNTDHLQVNTDHLQVTTEHLQVTTYYFQDTIDHLIQATTYNL